MAKLVIARAATRAVTSSLERGTGNTADRCHMMCTAHSELRRACARVAAQPRGSPSIAETASTASPKLEKPEGEPLQAVPKLDVPLAFRCTGENAGLLNRVLAKRDLARRNGKKRAVCRRRRARRACLGGVDSCDGASARRLGGCAACVFCCGLRVSAFSMDMRWGGRAFRLRWGSRTSIELNLSPTSCRFLESRCTSRIRSALAAGCFRCSH